MKTVTPETIISAREAAGMTQSDAALLCRLEPVFWRRCEQGTEEMSVQTYMLFQLLSGNEDFGPMLREGRKRIVDFKAAERAKRELKK